MVAPAHTLVQSNLASPLMDHSVPKNFFSPPFETLRAQEDVPALIRKGPSRSLAVKSRYGRDTRLVFRVVLFGAGALILPAIRHFVPIVKRYFHFPKWF